jgi:molybdopterin-guanine dinucleotide biosynthesis protein A
MQAEESQITLAVLAGGEGARMGQPKGMLTVRGEPILAYLLRQFRWIGPTLLVTAPGREHPPAWEQFSGEVTDPVAGQGPLRGVLTALEASATPFILITTVDMPEVTRVQLEWLADQQQTPALGIMLRQQGSGRIEPFPSIFHRDAVEPIRERLKLGQSSVQMLAESGVVLAKRAPGEWPDRIWTNLNRPEEFAEWQRSIQ